MTRSITYTEALNEALHQGMSRDPEMILLGEDVGGFGGLFQVTKGLQDKFGDQRVMDTPISEAAIAGAGVGAALVGTRAVIEFQFNDFMMIGMDQIVNHAAKLRYMTGGQAKVPLVIRAPICTGVSLGAQHSQSLHSWFVHVPGLIVIMPSTPYAAKGLLNSAIRNDNPVVFYEHRRLYATKGEVPEEDYEVPIGEAKVAREGRDVTIVATGIMVVIALAAAETLSAEGIEVEIIDPQTLKPLDTETIFASVEKTARLVVASEGWPNCSFASEVSARVAESAIDYLDAPIQRVTFRDAPMPVARQLESYILADEEKIIHAVKIVMGLEE